MKKSREEQAEEEANLFEDAFYEWMEEIRHWLGNMQNKPNTLGVALEHPDIQEMLEVLPPELYLNFETELDFIIEGTTRTEDAQYD